MSATNSAEKSTRKKRILLIDDHAIVRMGLRALLEREEDMEVCGEAGTVEEGLEAIFSLHPMCVVVDLSIKDRNGLDLIRTVRERLYFGKILVLSMHDESIYAEKAIRAGAQGYVMKDQADEVFITALRAVLSGQIYAGPKIISRLLGQISEVPVSEETVEPTGVDSLTPREGEILYCIGDGLSTRDIAEKFGLSGRTVDAHRVNIRRKLGCKSIAEVIARAIIYKRDIDLVFHPPRERY